MQRKTTITVQLPKPRNKLLNSLLVSKTKSGGTHVNKKDKRMQNRLLREIKELGSE
jgi:hypothetical protein